MTDTTLNEVGRGVCPNCASEGERSCVYPGGSTTTLMSASVYYDEDGRQHVHDPNLITTHYHCSRGHGWSESETIPCPTCGHP